MKVLVLGCTRNFGITNIRALAASGHQVIGADDRPMPLRLNSRCADQYLTYTAETEEQEYEAIEKIVRRYRPDVLLPPTINESTEILVRHIRTISSYTNVLLPDIESYQRLTDKLWLYDACEKFRIPAPRRLSPEQAKKILSNRTIGTAEPAVVIKPREDIGGGHSVKIVSNWERVDSALEEVDREYGSAFISEFVPGPPEDVIAVNLLFDRESHLVDFFAFRKLMLWPPKTGGAALARSVFARDLVERLLPIFESLGWRGPADAEFKIDRITGEAKLLEINGRFSGALEFSIACGVNFPKLLCDAALGVNARSDLSPHYQEDVLYWNPKFFVKHVWTNWRTSGYRWRPIAEALSQVMESKVGSPWQFDDPAPTIGKALIACKDLVSLAPSRY